MIGPTSEDIFLTDSSFLYKQDIGFSQRQFRIIIRSTTGPIDLYLLRYLYSLFGTNMHMVKNHLSLSLSHTHTCINPCDRYSMCIYRSRKSSLHLCPRVHFIFSLITCTYTLPPIIDMYFMHVVNMKANLRI